MKRIYLGILSVMLIGYIFMSYPLFVKASPTQAEIQDQILASFREYFNVGYGNSADFDNVASFLINNTDYSLVMYQYSDFSYNVVCGKITSITNNSIVMNGSYTRVFYNNNLSSHTPTKTTTTNLDMSSLTKCHNFGTIGEYYEDPVDYSWSNVKYDISVPTPEMTVFWIDVNLNTYDSGVMSGQLGPEIPFQVKVKGNESLSSYYVYMDIQFWTPNSGKLSASNGIYEFEPQTMVKSSEYTYYNWSDLYSSPTITYNLRLNQDQINPSWPKAGDILNAWSNIRYDIENGLDGQQEMKFESNLTGNALSEGKQQINELLRNAALSGNRVRIRMCYYYIDENNFIRCGNFATWTSSQPTKSSSQQLSDVTQMQGEEANGAMQNVSVSEAVQQNNNNNNVPPINISTGSSNINVTVNNGDQAVPNNQNYPTVVSYNHDNIFTQFIGTYTNASQYLGGFAAFCNGVLLWIPAEIWAIIGMGFAMALVIMMIKII